MNQIPAYAGMTPSFYSPSFPRRRESRKQTVKPSQNTVPSREIWTTYPDQHPKHKNLSTGFFDRIARFGDHLITMQFTDKQIAFLMRVAETIPVLIDEIAKGNVHSEMGLGTRKLKNGTYVELKLVAKDAKSDGRGDNGAYPSSPHKEPEES